MKFTADQKITISFLEAGYTLHCERLRPRPYMAWAYEIANKKDKAVFKPHRRTIQSLIDKGVLDSKTLELTNDYKNE